MAKWLIYLFYTMKDETIHSNFTYQSVHAPQLAELRNLYRLDSVAGERRDIDQAIHLLGWFHQQGPHNDMAKLDTLTAKHIIETYRAQKHSQG